MNKEEIVTWKKNLNKDSKNNDELGNVVYEVSKEMKRNDVTEKDRGRMGW